MFYGAAYITNNSYNLPCFFSKNPVFFVSYVLFFRHFFLFFNTDPVGTLYSIIENSYITMDNNSLNLLLI